MSSYGELAPAYDALTRDVDYEAFADLYERIFASCGVKPADIIDLACGTGTISCILARRGYEVIGVDASEDMLAEAAEKAAEGGYAVPPVFVNQYLEELDLYGTASAAVCALDGIDYIPPEDLEEVFYRISLFVEPGGVFIFDVITPEEFRSRDGQTYTDETEDVLCLWRSFFDEEDSSITYAMDIFTRQGELWERSSEEHTEYAHTVAFLKDALEKSRFENVCVYTENVPGGAGRVFISARRNMQY